MRLNVAARVLAAAMVFGSAAAHVEIDEQIALVSARILASPRDAALYLKRGELHRVHADWASAVRDYDRASALDPAMAAVDLARGHMLLQAGRGGEALPVLGRAIRRMPGNARAIAFRAEALAAVGRPRAAARAWDQALLDAGGEEPLRPDWEFARARARQAAGLPVLAPPPVSAVSRQVAPVAAPPADPVQAAALILRGPYLQSATPSSIVVRWRTSVATGSLVYVSARGTNAVRGVRDPAAVVDHAVLVSGLTPDTRYAYAIGSGNQILASGPEFVFKTPPLAGSDAPTRIWVVGDSGTANAAAARVRDAYSSWTGDRDTDVWLMLGDNAYTDGTDREYQSAVFDMYPSMLRRVAPFSTFGNHDGQSASSGSQSGPYFDIFTLPRDGEAGGVPSRTEAYYSFDHANVHFVCLDSYESDRSPGSPMLTWLAADLAATAQQWVIAFWHHPPYSKGSHDSDYEIELVEMRENVLPILEAHGVDLVLSGHSHSYERSFLIDGHYDGSWTFDADNTVDGGDGRQDGDGSYLKPESGAAPHAGAVYVVAGSSGQTSGGGLDHPAMFISLDELGSLVLDVAGAHLDASFLDDGGRLRDHFSIVKDAAEGVGR